jgi:glycosyltransferase involved in cell wall biosynthesis
MRLAIVNSVWDPRIPTAEALLDQYATLTGWAEAALAAGCESVVVCQRFSTRGDAVRGGVTYRFRSDRGTPNPGMSFAKADGVVSSATAARPDVVHVNGPLHPSLVRRLRGALPKRAAIVVQDHGGLDPAHLSLPRRLAIRRGLAAADALFVSSRGHAEAWRESGAAPKGLAIDEVMEASTTMTPVARDEARRASGVEGSPAVLWVGRLNANKDPLTVLRGFAQFAGRLPTARLTMVYGAADLLPEAQCEIARTPALQARVRLIGHVSHDLLSSYYSAADVFVLGSHAEGSGYAAIEAMACGAIPVVTDIPSFRALTGGGRIGALWTPGEPSSLADALANVGARPLAREREATRARFESAFTWRAIGRRAVEIYQRAIDARQGRAGGTSHAERRT